MAGSQLSQATVLSKEGEGDDTSFIRTEDVVCLLCSSGDGTKRGYLAADGFGSQFCYLEAESREEEACELWKCTFQLEESLSVHAMSTYRPKKKQGHRKILMYGQAVLLRHQGTKKLLRCLATSPANDKLAYHIGFSEKPGVVDENCWFMVCPSSKQRSDGEKVRTGDDIFLRSVSNERYLSAQLSYLQNVESDAQKHSNIVQASFQQSVWTLHIVCSGSAREAAIGYVNGTDVVHLLHRHGSEDCLSVAARDSDKNATAERTCSEVCYQCPLMAPLRTLWRVELFMMKFGGGFTGWRQPFRLRHVVTGKFLGVKVVHRTDARCTGGSKGRAGEGEGGGSELANVQRKTEKKHVVALLEPSEATFKASAFCFSDATSTATVAASSKDLARELMMGEPQVKFGDSEVFLVHLDTDKIVGCPVSERSQRLLSGSKKKKVLMQRESHQGQSFTVTRASEEQAKAAGVVQLMEGTMRNYVQKVIYSPSCERTSSEHLSHNLLHLLTDLTHYFHLPPPPSFSISPNSHTSSSSSPPPPSQTHDSWQAELCLLRERQELFQKQGMLLLTLNVIIETGQKCRLICNTTTKQIHHKLYELLAAMIRGSRKNCSVFATEKWLKVFIDQLSMPQFTHDVLEVIQCLLADSPEVLNIITKDHIQVIVNLLLSRGRDEVVMRLLSSLCVCSEVAMREKQRLIHKHLLDCRDLLIQTSLHDHIHCLHPNLYVGAHEGSAMHQKWYYEAEITQIPAQHADEHFHIRIGWAHTTLFRSRPSSNSFLTTSGGIGDDLYSIAFDGEYFWFGGESFQSRPGKRKLQRQEMLSDSPTPSRSSMPHGTICVGDVIGCHLDLSAQEVWFTKNGRAVPGRLHYSHLDDMITPAISVSNSVSMVLSFGKHLGPFSHAPPSDFAGLFEAATPGNDEFKLQPFVSVGCSQDLDVSGPIILANYQGFVPAPIDTGGRALPDPLHSIRDQLACNLHEVWAKNKIEAGYRFAEVRNDDLKQHPLLCPVSSLSPEDSQYDYSMAYETLATLLVLGYNIVPPDDSRAELKYQELEAERYQQSNGYLPRPLDLDSLKLEEDLMGLVERLAENCHSVWAAGRIRQGWTYGKSTDADCKRNPLLVPYDKLDASAKKSNWDSAYETVRSVLALGCSIIPPPSSSTSSSSPSLSIHQLTREYSQSQVKIRNFRGQHCFAVKSGKWYYEVKVKTDGMMRVGWASPSFPAHLPLGDDEHSYAFDGFLVCKWHSGRESFGQRWSAGDVVGCLLDLDAGQVAFSLNGELLQDSLGSTVAFEGLTGVPLTPAVTLAAGQSAQINFGRSEEALHSDYSSLGYRALCSPSALHFNIPLWYSSPHESLEVISPSHPRLNVVRKPSERAPNSRSFAVLSVSCRNWDYSQNAQPECLRLNTGILVTPEMESRPSFARQFSVHPRPGPFSPTPTTDMDIYRAFADYFSPKKHIISYTAVIPAGQDPRFVFLGWTTAQFCYVASQFQTGSWNGDSSESVYGQTLEYMCSHGDHSGSKAGPSGMEYSHSSAYLVCVNQLLTGFTDQNLAISMRVVCTLDLLSGHMTFSTAVPGQEVSPEAMASQKVTLRVRKRCKLFPTVITTPSTEKVIDLDFTPDLCCHSISSTLTPPSSGAKLPSCPPRFKMMVLTPSQWVRQAFKSVPYTSVVTSEGAVKVQSHKEPTYSICATLPEEDVVINLLELSEHEKLLKFHICSLEAYKAVSSHCNESIAKKVGDILDSEQLLHCLELRGMQSSLRTAYIDLFNSLHLELEVRNKLITRGEFILPLSECHRSIPLFSPQPKHKTVYQMAAAVSFKADPALMNRASLSISSFAQTMGGEECEFNFSVQELKDMVFYNLEKLLSTKYYKGIILPRSCCSEIFVPLLTLLDNLLVVGAVHEEEDLKRLLALLDPEKFPPKGTQFREGLLSLNVATEEPIKLVLCSVLQHLCDCQVQHRVESTVAFAAGYVESLQKDQRERYKKTFAKKPKEFRSSPEKQVETMLSFKQCVSCDCPTPAHLQKALHDFHRDLQKHCGVSKTSASTTNKLAEKSLKEKLKALAQLLWQALLPSGEDTPGRERGEGGREANLQHLIMATMIRWAQQPIHSPELIQQIFALLYRQCDEINEVVQALQKTYVIDVVEDCQGEVNFNIPAFRRALGSLRLLLKVGMGREEEMVLKKCLRTISHSDVFYCHPHLLRSLGVHLTVLGLMRSYLGISVAGLEDDRFLTARRKMKMAMSKEGLPAPVEWCCKFLCSFARVSSDNQRALFDHISYLLEHSEKNSGCMTCQGCTPLDVATATIRDNTELCLALDDAHLQHVVSLLVATTTSVTGGGGSMEQGGSEEGRDVPPGMVAVGSMMCEWAPNGGEKCLDFLQCAVWADGEQIQENAYVIVRLLIHHSECLGPALAGEAIGLHRVYEDALDHMFDTPQFGSSRASPRDSTDLSSASPLKGSLAREETVVFPEPSPLNDSFSAMQRRSNSYMNLNLMNTRLMLSFYTSLVRLLAYCAQAKHIVIDKPANGNGSNGSTVSGLNDTSKDHSGSESGLDGTPSGSSDSTTKKSGAERTRNILSNLISVEDVKGILSLPFARDGRQGIIPAHKEAALLFLSRVYGVTDSKLLRDLLTDAFLPDIKTALKLASTEERSPLSVPLTHYLCFSVLPLLTQYAAMLPQLLAHLHIIANLLMCCCRLGSTCQLTARQLGKITAFLTATLKCLHPGAMQRFMPKIIADVPHMKPHSIMYMELLSSHFTYFARYYESGQRCFGLASEEEKVWSALVVYRLLDTLSNKLPHEKLERSCVACLQAVSCAIVPDTLLPSQCQLSTMCRSSAVGYDPRPACIAQVTMLRSEVKQFVNDFANFLHDCWVFEQQSMGWTYGAKYCEKNHEDPNLRPLSSLPAEVKMEYLTPIEEAIKHLIVRGWCLSKVRAADISGIPIRARTRCLRKKKKKDGREEEVYEPEVLDLSKVSTPVKLLASAEMMAEDAHDRWASNLKKTSTDYHSHPFFQPYELLDDVMKEERRTYALDLLRYMRISGFELLRTGTIMSQSRRSSMCHERFSLQFFEKFLQFLSKSLEPVYYSRVLFPTLASYLNKNRGYFIPVGGQRSGRSASREEKLTILRLFCRVMDYAHLHKRLLFSSVHRHGSKLSLKQLTEKAQSAQEEASEEKGSLFREIHSLIEAIVRSLDLKAIVIGTGSVGDQCPDVVTFFKQTLETIKCAQSEMTQQKELKNSYLLSYSLSLLIPTLTVLFNHVGYRDVSRLLMQGIVLNYCRVIFQTLVEMATGVTPVFVGTSPIVVIGQCMGAFSRAYPDPFLEKQLFGFDLASLLNQLDVVLSQGSTAGNVLYVVDIVIPVLSNYIAKWWSNSTVECSGVTTEQVDFTLSQILSLVASHFTLPMRNVRWFVRIIDSSLALSHKCSLYLLTSHFLPMCVGLSERATALWHAEQLITAHITNSGMDGHIEELVTDYTVLVRDLTTTLLFLVVFLKWHSEELREAGKKNKKGEEEEEGGRRKYVFSTVDASSSVNALFVAVADIFHCWFSSPHLRRTFLAGTQWLAQHSILKGCTTAHCPQKGTRSAQPCNPLMVCLNLLLPIVDQYLTRKDRDLVSHCSEKLAEKGASCEDVKMELIKQLDMQQQATSYGHLGHKLVKTLSLSLIAQPSSVAERVEHIVGLARVRHRMKVVGKSEGDGARSKWKQLFTRRKRKAVLACFLAVPYFEIRKHRAINLFLQTYCRHWLKSTESHTHTVLSDELLDHQDYLATFRRSSLPPNYQDPLTQLFTMMKRQATSGEGFDHELFTAYPEVLSKIIAGVVEDERASSDDNVTVAFQNYHKRRAELFVRQNQLAKRGAASMVLLVITSAQGNSSAVIHSILKLGIALLEEGNSHIQGEMLNQLQAMDVGFLASVAHLIVGCSVLDWNAYERYQKSETMHSNRQNTCLASAKVLSESTFTKDLFRFLQLLCEGHNTAFQNYLRTQAGNTTTVNIITCSVDYLLRLQESVSDFYWHYSGRETIDLLGRDSLLKAFRVAKQVFRTLTEYIQGPCVENQETLAHSRLLDAVSGFLQVFAILQRKLYQDTSQMELLRELLGLQEEMFILLLSMLEGSAMSSQLGRLMVDMLVESEQWIQDIMAFFSIFIKLKDITTSKAFKEYDLNKDGMISYKEFEMAMESQQRYSKDEIAYLMDCADTNKDGLLDYMEFTERFHQPAENIGFHLCVLIVHLSEHLPKEKRLQQFKTSPQGRELMDHFEQGMGSIEIQGKSGRIERVYFEVKQSRLIQWNETQIQESRRSFLHSVEMGSHKKKLDGFISFCEDTIFEMDYADKISGSEQQSRESRAFQHRLRHTKALQTVPQPLLPSLWEGVRTLCTKYSPLQRVIGILAVVWTLLLARLLLPLKSLARRGRNKVRNMIPRFQSQRPTTATQQPTATTTPTGSGSRLETLAKRGGLRLSIPSNAPQSQNVPTAPPAPPNEQKNPRVAERVTLPPQLMMRSSSLSGRIPSQNDSFVLPRQPQATPSVGPFSVHKLNLHYDRSHMRPPSSDNPLTTPQEDQKFPTGNAESYVPKITLSTRGWQAFVARHYYRLTNLKLLVTFLINIVLLSFTVHSFSQEQAALNCASTPPSNSSLPHKPSLSCVEEMHLVWNPLYLKLLSAFHFFLSFLLILSYWNLKVPLIIFKREKEIARRLEANQMWVWSQPKSPGIANLCEWGMADWCAWLCDQWDGIVISAPSFPRNYWDKQVKDRVCYQFEGINRELVAQRLGMRARCRFECHSKWQDVFTTFHSLGDLRYFIWVLGTVLSNMMVLYHILYCGLSLLGLQQNSFYFSIHLLDLVMNFKLLRTVLRSVLHNGKQLLMTVLMTCVVIYLYTVVAFNYFRKFYIQQSPAGGEGVYTCDGMAKCFIYHIDKGLRAGGGIGDVLKSASGDPDEIFRLFFDVTFFFFVIVILLAIIQGLIIDAFGELRDREESITTDMKNKCFVCGLSKAEFDHIAHGFDNHVTREHNTAHYMFFLLYLIRKQESEFSGQESYVWEMYLKRKWDFFPVGDSFRGQEERRAEGVRSKPKGHAQQSKLSF